MLKKTLAILALPALVSLSLVSPIASAQISFSDDFDNRNPASDLIIGNNWRWFDTTYAADCTTYISGYGPYTPSPPISVEVDNQTYARLNPLGSTAYYRAGLQGATNDASLEVYQNQYATGACNQIKIFQEFAGGAPGDYTFTAKVIGNQYTPIQGSVGVFMKVLDVDNGYSEAQFVKKAVTPPAYDAAAGTVKFNFRVESNVSNRIVQVGMYAQHASGETASAIWDDISIDVAADPGPEGIPVLPLWALFGLAGLIGLMGLRRKS